jgi:hypothetical protein
VLLQVVLWEVDRHQQLQPKGSVTEKGCTITQTVLASRVAGGSGGQLSSAAAYYAISTPGSGTVTIKWLDEQGGTGVVQVRRQANQHAMSPKIRSSSSSSRHGKCNDPTKYKHCVNIACCPACARE